jgi:ACS family hexuronate transporter-like MFS transporter
MNAPPSQRTRYAWLVVLVLFFGSVINYVDRTVLSVVMPRIREDLSLTNYEYGLAVNAFLVMYAIFYITGGRLADWLGYRRTFTLTIIFWSIASMLHAAAQGLRSLCLFRGLLGMGEGGYYPTAMRAAAELFPPESRAKAVGVLLCGLSVGALITPPTVAWITLNYGWRMAFIVTGALGALLLPPWFLLHHRIRRVFGPRGLPPAHGIEEATGTESTEEPSVAEVLRCRKYWCVLAARAMTDSAWYFYLFWLPGYFQEARGFDLRMVGLLLWIPYFAADLGALSGAWASSALIKRGLSVDRARKTILIPSAALSMFGAMTYFVAGSYAAIAVVSLALFTHLSWSSNIHTVITEIAPPRHVAVLYGITGAAGTLMGALTQPILGHLVDVSGYAPAFLYAGSAYAVAITFLLSAGKIERIRRRQAR